MTSFRVPLLAHVLAVALVVVGLILGTSPAPAVAQRAPSGQAVMAWHVTIRSSMVLVKNPTSWPLTSQIAG